MSEFLRLIWDICCLRRGPQDLPYAPLLLGVLCASEFALHLIALHVLPMQQGSLLSVAFLLAFNLGALYLLLALREKSSRFVQAALALIGSSLVFQLMFVPITLVFGTVAPGAEQHLTGVQHMAGLLALALLCWDLMVDAHILKHSLDVRFALGVLIAVLWRIAEYALNVAAVGGAGAPTA